MKRSAVFLACSIALTLLFYLLAYFFLPPPPPSAALMLLFAGIAMVLVWVAQMSVHCLRSGRRNTDAAKLLLLVGVLSALVLGMSACGKAGNGRSSQANASTTAPRASASSAEPAPPPRTVPMTPSAVTAGGGADPLDNAMPRVTGTALLASGQKEDDGYGLYSYALLSHPPSNDEMAKYRAFFAALLNLPSTTELVRYLTKQRINITYIPVESVPTDWEQLPVEGRVNFVIAHYDYARGAALLASLTQQIGSGPVITSLLKPLNVSRHPHPVLVQDLSTAQTALIHSYVAEFVHQAAQDRFWQPNTLQDFALSLRNVMETAANGLGMSQEAVLTWVQYFK
jgi:hypothetical protein